MLTFGKVNTFRQNKMKKTIQQILEEERKISPLKDIDEARINRTLANQAKAQDPEFQKKRLQGFDKLRGTDEWKEKLRKRSDNLKNNKEWQEKTKNANSRENWTEDKLKNVQISNKIRSDKIEWKKRFCKKIQTPDGIFESQTAAAKHYGLDRAAIATRRKKFPNEWYYIDDKIT